ncbi:MAG: phenylalanine--tRNA ligase subunit beta [bacterium]
MRVPFSWLREYCDPGLPVAEVAELLSMRAVEVERVSRVGAPSQEGFVVGRVVSAEKHPNADRLRVCEVETGDGVRAIVCGAPNIAAGQTVPVALPGAVMGDGQELGRAKLRGVVSDGMVLSEAELQIGEDSDGIVVLDEGPAAGTPLADVLPIAESVLELDLNPNRVDCFGVYGVAREVHAITGAELAPPPWSDDAGATADGEASEHASVKVEVPGLCPRFTARVFTDVQVGPSPLWLKARLMAAGQRPISNVVDVTNYVMLLTAQPLHAFDLEKVPGGELIVRTALDGERMTTLDGVERELDPETVLVCDRNGPSGIAGIMGGQVSEVSGDTTRLLLEVANWDGVNILRTSSTLGLRSEASTRFEKQLHPETTIWAQRVASRLLGEIAGARMVGGTIDEAAEIPAPHVVSLHGARLDSLLGIEVPRERAASHLERLGFALELEGETDLIATVPLHRHYDVTREADLIEEVGRLEGFDRLPRMLPASRDRVGRLTREQLLRRRAEDELSDLGFDEIVAWRFGAPALADRLRLADDDARRPQLAMRNPLSEDQSAMRTTLIAGLLDAASHNLSRGAERVALFECGRAYLRQPPPLEGGPLAGAFAGELPPPVREPHLLGALAVGPLRPQSWGAAPVPAGFYELKGSLEALCARLAAPLAVEPSAEPFLHPGRAGRVVLGGVAAGWLGELHPTIAAGWDLPGGVAFELDLAALVAASASGLERFEDVTSFPAVLQDLAVVVGDDIPAEQVRVLVLEAGGELLRSARVFDLYRGDQVGEGRKSLALRLEFAAPDRTLTDEEVSERREAIREGLGEIGGALRE